MQERPMQWFTGSAWSSAGTSPFPPWRAAFITRLVSGMVAVSLPLKIRVRTLSKMQIGFCEEGMNLFSALKCTGSCLENWLNPVSYWKWAGSCLWEGSNPVSALPLRWTGIQSVWEWIGFGLVLEKCTMMQILPLRMGRIHVRPKYNITYFFQLTYKT